MTDPNQKGPRALNDAELDALFSASAVETLEPSGDFMARILADAQAAQPSPAAIAVPPKLGFWERAQNALGGWPAMAGLAATGCVGVLLGISAPDLLTLLTDSVLNTDVYLSDFLPGVDGVLTDG